MLPRRHSRARGSPGRGRCHLWLLDSSLRGNDEYCGMAIMREAADQFAPAIDLLLGLLRLGRRTVTPLPRRHPRSLVHRGQAFDAGR